MELFLHTLRFLQPIFTHHIDPMCDPFTLRVPLVWRWNNSRRKTPWKIPPCPEVVLVFLGLDLGSRPILRPWFSLFPSPLNPHMHGPSPPNLLPPPNVKQLYSWLARNCCYYVLLPSLSAPFFSAILCVAPNIRSLPSPNQISLQGFIYDPSIGYDVINLHRRCPWAEMDRKTAGYKLWVWIVLDSYVL